MHTSQSLRNNKSDHIYRNNTVNVARLNDNNFIKYHHSRKVVQKLKFLLDKNQKDIINYHTPNNTIKITSNLSTPTVSQTTK